MVERSLPAREESGTVSSQGSRFGRMNSPRTGSSLVARGPGSAKGFGVLWRVGFFGFFFLLVCCRQEEANSNAGAASNAGGRLLPWGDPSGYSMPALLPERRWAGEKNLRIGKS